MVVENQFAKVQFLSFLLTLSLLDVVHSLFIGVFVIVFLHADVSVPGFDLL